MYGITYKNKHSYNDFGLTIKSKSIPPPNKVKIKATVPFMNGAYDFSNLYNGQTYEERKLQYVFNLVGRDKLDMNVKKIKIIDWLINSFKDKLEDDTIPGYYFMAECDGVDFKEAGFVAEITANFTAYSFKLALNNEGADIFDEFNFELDYAQETKFSINGSKNITLYNPSAIKITPTIICSADMSIIKGSTTYNFKSGTTKDYRFMLSKGQNDLNVKGSGNIEFVFRKEVL